MRSIITIPYVTWGAKPTLTAVHLRNPLLDRVHPLAHAADAFHGGHVAPVHRALHRKYNRQLVDWLACKRGKWARKLYPGRAEGVLLLFLPLLTLCLVVVYCGLACGMVCDSLGINS